MNTNSNEDISCERDSIWPPKETLSNLTSQTPSPTETNVSTEESQFLSQSNPQPTNLLSRCVPISHICPIGCLPNELLIKIFKYIPSSELTSTVSVVCKQWRHVALSTSLYRELYLNGQAPQAISNKLLADRPCLQVLHCTALKCFSRIVASVCRLRYLQCLDMGFCDLDEVCAIKLSNHLPITLRHINVEGCRGVACSFIKNMVERCPDLEALNLSHCVRLDDDCLIILGTGRLRSLRRLNIDGIQWISDMGLREGLTCLAPQLNAIWFDGFEISTLGLATFLGQATYTLQILSVRFSNNLNDAILPVIGELCGLRELTLRKNHLLTPTALQTLFTNDIDPRFAALTSIDLSECTAVTDEVIDAICDCCGPQLLKLLLNWCWNVSDVGLTRILGCCHSLRHISLVGNHVITGESLICLPDQLPHLRFLNLTQCNQIVDAVICSVARQIPSLYIFDHFGERVGGVDDVCQYDLLRVINREPICEH